VFVPAKISKALLPNNQAYCENSQIMDKKSFTIFGQRVEKGVEPYEVNLPGYIRLGRKCLSVKNILAYCAQNKKKDNKKKHLQNRPWLDTMS
jgi:hypothetical protein